MKFFGTVNNKILKVNDQQAYNQFIESLDGKVKIEVKKIGKNRTLQQNSYYWLYLGIIATDTGNLADDLHEFLKRKLLPPVTKTILGTEIVLPASTTNQSKLEFMDYITKIEALTGIPSPDTELYLYE